MGKRKKRSSAPNISAETLERARQQVSGVVEEKSANELRSEAERRAERAARRAARRQKADPDAPRKPKGLSAQAVAELLANPTHEVSEDAMRTQYSYVVADLRSMGILAAVLVVVLLLLGYVQTLL